MGKNARSICELRRPALQAHTTYPAIQIFIEAIYAGIKGALEEDSPDQNAQGKGGCPLEKAIVDVLYERHVDLATRQEAGRSTSLVIDLPNFYKTMAAGNHKKSSSFTLVVDCSKQTKIKQYGKPAL